MDVSDEIKERMLDEKIYVAMVLLAVIYSPGCSEVIVIRREEYKKKSKNRLTLRLLNINLYKLIVNKGWLKMALTQCPECKKEISDSAQVCPHCGLALKPVVVEVKEKKPMGCFLRILLLILVLAIGSYIVGKVNKKPDGKVISQSEAIDIPKGCVKHIEVYESSKSNLSSIKIWEHPDPERGKVLGEIKPGSRAVIIKELNDGYIIQSPWDQSIGYINKVQVKKTLFVNTDSLKICNP